MRWYEFSTQCPELAELATARFAADQLALLGTLRADGSPRISAVELVGATRPIRLSNAMNSALRPRNSAPRSGGVRPRSSRLARVCSA